MSKVFQKFPLWLGVVSGLWLIATFVWASFAAETETTGASWTTAAGCGGLLVSLLLYLLKWFQRPITSLADISLIVLHLGLAMVFGGQLLNEILGERGFVFLMEGASTHHYVDYLETDRALPFELKLNSFNVVAYPGSLRVKDYQANMSADGQSFDLAVNSPHTIGDWQIFQHDCGVEVSNKTKISVLIETPSGKKIRQVSMLEPFVVDKSTTGTIVDFVPSAMPGKNAEILTSGRNILLNPAFLMRFENDWGEVSNQWVFTGTEAPRVQLGSAGISVQGIKDVQYTVLSLVKMPFNWLIFLGISVGCLGLFVYLFPTKKKP